jgi:hypothetical protein
VNSQSLAEVYREQLRSLTCHAFLLGNYVGKPKYVNKEWNYVLKQYPELLEKVTRILKEERNRGVVNRKGVISLYFDKSLVAQTMANGTWTNDGKWFSENED